VSDDPFNLREDGKEGQYKKEICSKFRELNWKLDDKFDKNIISLNTLIKWRQKENKTIKKQWKILKKYLTYQTFHDVLPRTAELDLLNKEILYDKGKKKKIVRLMQGHY
jgi:hypothetical protein